MELKRRRLEMGRLLLLFLLRSCLLSAVDGTLTFCSQPGFLGNTELQASGTQNDNKMVVNILWSSGV